MAITRLEALTLLNAMLQKLGEVALADVDFTSAMISVWGLYRDRIDNALALCAQRGLRLTEDELVAMATYWRHVWLLGVKEKPGKCPLCEAPTPANEDFLCKCFEGMRVGQYIDYTVPGVIRELAANYPGRWRDIYAESFRCQTCDSVVDIALGKIADKLNQGKPWRTPRYCIKCSAEHHQRKQQAVPSSQPPKAVPGHTTVEDSILDSLPPPAES